MDQGEDIGIRIEVQKRLKYDLASTHSIQPVMDECDLQGSRA